MFLVKKVILIWFFSDVKTGKMADILNYYKNVSWHAEVDLSTKVEEKTLIFLYFEFINILKK